MSKFVKNNIFNTFYRLFHQLKVKPYFWVLMLQVPHRVIIYFVCIFFNFCAIFKQRNTPLFAEYNPCCKFKEIFFNSSIAPLISRSEYPRPFKYSYNQSVIIQIIFFIIYLFYKDFKSA